MESRKIECLFTTPITQKDDRFHDIPIKLKWLHKYDQMVLDDYNQGFGDLFFLRNVHPAVYHTELHLANCVLIPGNRLYAMEH